MKMNVGTLDRVLRVGAGVVLVALTLAGAIGAWGWIGLLPIVTGTLGVCPLYSLLGIKTCPVKSSPLR
jgi:hypothetical protein